MSPAFTLEMDSRMDTGKWLERLKEGRFFDFLAVGIRRKAVAERGDEFHQPFCRIPRPAPCDLFHKPPAQQEKQQHGDGLEIHSLPRIDGKAVNARDKGHHDGNRNRRIHADAAVFPIAPCAAVKR